MPRCTAIFVYIGVNPAPTRDLHSIWVKVAEPDTSLLSVPKYFEDDAIFKISGLLALNTIDKIAIKISSYYLDCRP